MKRHAGEGFVISYGKAMSENAMHSWVRYVQGRAYFDMPLTEGTDYKIVKDSRPNARATTGARGDA